MPCNGDERHNLMASSGVLNGTMTSVDRDASIAEHLGQQRRRRDRYLEREIQGRDEELRRLEEEQNARDGLSGSASGPGTYAVLAPRAPRAAVELDPEATPRRAVIRCPLVYTASENSPGGSWEPEFRLAMSEAEENRDRCLAVQQAEEAGAALDAAIEANEFLPACPASPGPLASEINAAGEVFMAETEQALAEAVAEQQAEEAGAALAAAEAGCLIWLRRLGKSEI